MTEFMLLKINSQWEFHTASHTGRGSSVFLRVFFPPVLICQLCFPVPYYKGTWGVTICALCVVQEADKIPPRMVGNPLLPLLVQPCWPHTFMLSLLLCCILLFSCTLLCLLCAASFLLLQLSAMLERQFTFGRWFSFVTNPLTMCFFCNTP